MRDNFDEKKLISLIGVDIERIEKYDNGTFDNGYYIVFSNGLVLAAQDGEYGDNAFEFVDKKRLKSKILEVWKN